MPSIALAELLAANPIAPYIREGDMAARKPWRYPERRLLDYLLVLVLEGQCRFTVDGAAYPLGPGECCLIQPGSLVDLEGLTETKTPFLHLDLFYRNNRHLSFPTRPGQCDLTDYQALLQPRLNDIYGFEVPVKLRPSHPARFRDTFLRLVELWPLRDPPSMLLANRLATELVTTVLLDHYELRSPARPAQTGLEWIPSYLSNHLQEPLSVGTLAERAHLSVSRFNVLFRRRFGRSPHQYLLDMRVGHAGELLAATALPLGIIAEYCGFADIHHFAKAFKRRTGMPPGEYRKVNGQTRNSAPHE